MAKMMKSDMMCPSECGPKCIVLGLLAAAFAAAGLWMLVGGVGMQITAEPMQTTFLWYFGGFVLWCIAKMCKMKACGMCR